MKHDPCPVCRGTTTVRAGEVDANKTCEDHKGSPPFAPAGWTVDYRQCMDCGLTYAPWMLSWSPDRFARDIYNAAYLDADPDASGSRAENNAAMLMARFRMIDPGRHLDYGGGDGTLSRILREAGWKSESYDPFHGDERPSGRFDLITAFEVIEHVADVQRFVDDVRSMSEEKAGFWGTTLLHDGVKDVTKSWYVAPRNGHVMIHTRKSLGRLLNKAGYLLSNNDQLMHRAYRSEVPSWACLV